MCGITGLWLRSPPNTERAREQLERMTAALHNRGPDDGGIHYEAASGIGFGHRRLSIVDLSAEGHQPMQSASGRYLISFNGEVYNFVELRRQLELDGSAPAFRGHSDTEVMLACIEAWGIERAVGRFVGMFAFALWDRAERSLHLVRDRLGIKPLFYGRIPDGLVFGSELKALTAHTEFSRNLARPAVAAYFQMAYVPAPLSIYEAARKVLPGTILSFPTADWNAPRQTRFWSADTVVRQGLQSPFLGTDDEAIDELDSRLREAVKLRMIADVPLGAFLSGGIDSSAVVALMQAQTTSRVRTFSIGNETTRFDEAGNAGKVAAHLGTDHTSLMVTSAMAREVIPELPRMYDEPFADSSQIPTFLVSQLARQHVTVALSGDGGDELFGGYNRHLWAPRLWSVLRRLPLKLRRGAAAALRAPSTSAWDSFFEAAGNWLPRIGHPGRQAHKLSGVLEVDSAETLYRELSSFWAPGAAIADAAAFDPSAISPGVGGPQRMLFLDLVTYLPDDILTKVDRASMAVSLEARVPILDHRVVEFAWRLPFRTKIRRNVGKWALRQVLHRYVPEALVSGPKMGFAVPIGDWLRGPLRPWAEELLSEQSMRADGLLESVPIRAKWQEHLSGHHDWSAHLWIPLMFQQWRQAL